MVSVNCCSSRPGIPAAYGFRGRHPRGRSRGHLRYDLGHASSRVRQDQPGPQGPPGRGRAPAARSAARRCATAAAGRSPRGTFEDNDTCAPTRASRGPATSDLLAGRRGRAPRRHRGVAPRPPAPLARRAGALHRPWSRRPGCRSPRSPRARSTSPPRPGGSRPAWSGPWPAPSRSTSRSATRPRPPSWPRGKSNGGGSRPFGYLDRARTALVPDEAKVVRAPPTWRCGAPRSPSWCGS